jgi:hypothetical protein
MFCSLQNKKALHLMSAFAQRGRRRLREAKRATVMPGKSRRKMSLSWRFTDGEFFHRLFVDHALPREYAIRDGDDDWILGTVSARLD